MKLKRMGLLAGLAMSAVAAITTFSADAFADTFSVNEIVYGPTGRNRYAYDFVVQNNSAASIITSVGFEAAGYGFTNTPTGWVRSASSGIYNYVFKTTPALGTQPGSTQTFNLSDTLLTSANTPVFIAVVNNGVRTTYSGLANGPLSPVPLPDSAAIFGAALLGLGGFAFWRKRRGVRVAAAV